MSGLRVLGLIPARGGSKGIPRKNARPLAGRPLLTYTVAAAREARGLARVVLSTEDDELAAIGRAAGAEVPFRRPAALAADDTPTVEVVLHALAELEAAGDRFDAVCLLQPTAPFRRPGMIDACIELLAGRGVDTVISVRPVPAEYNPHWVFVEDAGGLLHLSTGEASPLPRRQALPPAYHRDGAVYVTRTEALRCRRSLFGATVAGYVTVDDAHVNVDGEDDWARAEALAAARAADGRGG